MGPGSPWLSSGVWHAPCSVVASVDGWRVCPDHMGQPLSPCLGLCEQVSWACTSPLSCVRPGTIVGQMDGQDLPCISAIWGQAPGWGLSSLDPESCSVDSGVRASEGFWGVGPVRKLPLITSKKSDSTLTWSAKTPSWLPLGDLPRLQDSVGIQDLGAGWGRAGPLTHFFLSEDSAVAGPGGAGRPETESRCGESLRHVPWYWSSC